ncbi:hypothetical protein GGF31_000481 [Allomyces arbusculus]|nr:hypothetical protein GGF31_000481 [Allomyces arbusculus]
MAIAVDRDLVVRGINILSGFLLLVAGILNLLWYSLQLAIVMGCYAIFFAAVIIGLEFDIALPIAKHPALSFLMDWLGRGFFYLFWGCLVIRPTGYFAFAGIVLILVGVFYIVVHFFVPSWPSAAVTRGSARSANTTTPAPPTVPPRGANAA